MNKIILIGCPGSGKSTLSFRLEKLLGYPVLHLDAIYHIDNEHHISREELVQKVNEFASSHHQWIIDGNYKSTVEGRVQLADTIVLLDMDTELCVQNAIERTKKERGADMAQGFDTTKVAPEFLELIQNFKENVLPTILELKNKYPHKEWVILHTYEEVDEWVSRVNPAPISIRERDSIIDRLVTDRVNPAPMSIN